MKNSLATGRRVLAYGEAKRGKYGAEMIHPEYRVQGDLSTPELQETLTPVYPTTEGVKQATLRKLTDQALDLLDTCAIEELLPPELSQGMMTLPEALRTLHRPPPTLQLSDLETGQHPAQRPADSGRVAGAQPQHVGVTCRCTTFSCSAAERQ